MLPIIQVLDGHLVKVFSVDSRLLRLLKHFLSRRLLELPKTLVYHLKQLFSVLNTGSLSEEGLRWEVRRDHLDWPEGCMIKFLMN